MNKVKRLENYIDSNEFYTKASIEDLFVFLNSLINRTNELSNNGIEDRDVLLNIKKIVQILYLTHGINKSKIKEQKYLGYLIDKHSDLIKTLETAIDKAEDNGGYGVDWRIKYEAESIESVLNSFGLDNEGNILKSLSDLKENVKENVKSQLK